ncbi:response regulator transcription factor [Viridibacillus arvi]|uniref:Regulator n=1 Tax=Viridibacillus arvi TaxID=263475 RepID=A0A0M0LL68_9BACL|nr:response regulator transcription factor [Viridibacillus arvi]KOO51825.1 regulator [Viridibacillus arvi]
MINILIIDDHPIVLEGSKNLFNNIDDMRADTEKNPANIPEIVQKTPYDVYLIDINMPGTNGIDVGATICSLQPEAKIILYTGDQIEDYYSLIVEKKIHGLLSKTVTKERILRTIRSTMDGDIILPWSFVDFVQKLDQPQISKQPLLLNEREKKILQFVVQGYTNSAIALEIDLTPRTVERNLSHIYHLLNVTTRTEAALMAKELKLID